MKKKTIKNKQVNKLMKLLEKISYIDPCKPRKNKIANSWINKIAFFSVLTFV